MRKEDAFFLVLHSSFIVGFGFLVSFGFAEAILHSSFFILAFKQLFVDFFLGNDAFVFP